ncbi:hypothetical protein J1605_021166 [Eschrichtius robustus]|uniref:Uncharacterized protein n=1 Tax=Eschrichtius robustus TaxID=9764 RepID=A0AB34HHQ1_ESCRO|nr:hypothetical protein J1605_021166 [Eschrichtius robustus]
MAVAAACMHPNALIHITFPVVSPSQPKTAEALDEGHHTSSKGSYGRYAMEGPGERGMGQRPAGRGGRQGARGGRLRRAAGREFPFEAPSRAGPNGKFGRVSETRRGGQAASSALSRALAAPRAGQRRARAICSAGSLASGRRAPAGAGGTMELKKDSNAVSIDMLLIVHSEKRRAAQGAHSDRQADPGAPPQRRGGNAPPARAPHPRPLDLLAPGPACRGGALRAPERGPRGRPAPQGWLRLRAAPLASRGNAQSRDCPG